MRIFLACEDERLKISMLMLVDSQPGMIVSGISDRIDDIAQQLETSQPDVLVLGWELPMESMHDLMADIHNLDYSPEVIFLSSSPKEREAIMSAGVDYFVVTNAPPDELIQILNDLWRSKKENHPLSTR